MINDIMNELKDKNSIYVLLSDYNNLKVRIFKTTLFDTNNINGIDGYAVSASVIINDNGNKPIQYISFSDVNLVDALKGFKNKLDIMANNDWHNIMIMLWYS